MDYAQALTFGTIATLGVSDGCLADKNNENAHLTLTQMYLQIQNTARQYMNWEFSTQCLPSLPSAAISPACSLCSPDTVCFNGSFPIKGVLALIVRRVRRKVLVKRSSSND